MAFTLSTITIITSAQVNEKDTFRFNFFLKHNSQISLTQSWGGEFMGVVCGEVFAGDGRISAKIVSLLLG